MKALYLSVVDGTPRWTTRGLTLGVSFLWRQKMPKIKKVKAEKIDGLSPEDIAKIRVVIRQVWSWSYPRKLCIKRCTRADGFAYCEKCGEKCPKLKVDHIIAVGDVDDGFLERLFTPSRNLQGLCDGCHKIKTKEERRIKAEARSAPGPRVLRSLEPSNLQTDDPEDSELPF